MTSSKVLSGLDTAATVYESFNDRIKVLSTKGVVPGLCVVLVGEDPASQIYVRTKSKKLKSFWRSCLLIFCAVTGNHSAVGKKLFNLK